MRILFLADNHYGTYCGRAVYTALQADYDGDLLEDDYGDKLADLDYSAYGMLVTWAIGDTPGAPHAPATAAAPLRAWLSQGVPMVLLHGGSASFWQWDWWRELVGYRWVRKSDADGFSPSVHPIVPYELLPVKGRHPLCPRLEAFAVPQDELYIELEETRPVQRLLEATHAGRSYAQAWATSNPWGGTVLGYLPGHDPAVAASGPNLANIRTLLDYALSLK